MSARTKDYYLPIAFLLATSMLYLTYFVENVLFLEVGIFAILLVIFFAMPRIKITNKNHAILYSIMVVFGILYLLRAIFDLIIAGEKQILFTNDYTVFFYIINGIILPLALVSRAKFQGKFTWVFLLTSLMLILSLFLSLDNFLQGKVQQTNDLRIEANDSLGVIEYGHLGLTATIMGVVLFLKRKEHAFFIYISFALILIGVISIFLAGTRSAMVAAVLIFLLFVLSCQKPQTIIPFFLLLAALVIFSEDIINFAESFDAAGPVIRIFRLINEEGDQSSGRTTIWRYALNQISDSPLFGVSCFFHTYDADVQYVHNSFIEVFYALGIGGLLMFTIMNIVAIKVCFRIFKYGNADMKCMAFLYLQYFILSQFSNTVLRLNLYWFFLAIVLCIYFNGLVNKPKRIVRQGTKATHPQPVLPQRLDPQPS